MYLGSCHKGMLKVAGARGTAVTLTRVVKRIKKIAQPRQQKMTLRKPSVARPVVAAHE